MRFITHHNVLVVGFRVTAISGLGLGAIKLVCELLGTTIERFNDSTIGIITTSAFGFAFIFGLVVLPIVALFLQGRDGLPRGSVVLPGPISRILNLVLLTIIGFMLWLFFAALWVGVRQALS